MTADVDRKPVDQVGGLLPAGAQGVWTWDVKRDRLYGDEVIARLCGMPARVAAAGAPCALFLRSVHADDAPRVQVAVDRAVKTGSTYREVFRIKGDEGLKTILASGQCYLDESGQPNLYPGVASDLGRIATLSNESLVRIEQLLERMHEVGSRELIDYMIDMALEEIRELTRGSRGAASA